MKRNTLLALAGGTLAAVAALAWALAPRPLAVEVALATVGPYEQAIVEDGRTRLLERYTITAPVAGRLARPSLLEGDLVAAGALLGELWPQAAPMLDARNRAELAARRDAANAALQRAVASAGQQRTALAQAQDDLARSEQLARQAFIAPTQLASVQRSVLSAQQGLQAAEAARRMAEFDLAQARAALDSGGAAAASGAPVQLRAPVSGRVLAVLHKSETVVAAGTPLLEIGDTSQLEVLAELLTTDALQAPPGATVWIERWGGPGRLQGWLRRVEPLAFTKVSALGVEEQRVKVLIDLAGPLPAAAAAAAAATSAPAPAAAQLGDGYRVAVRIVTQQQPRALQVPVSAVFPRAGQPEAWAVFVLDHGRARLRPVQLAGRNGSQAWLRDGLREGETVIVYPPAEVADGVRVRARSAAD